MRFADRIAVKDFALTGEGYLRVRATLSRTGIQDYYGWELGKTEAEWGRVFKVYRPADEVFSGDALASFRLRPITDGHPYDGVNAETWRKEAVGVVGEDTRRDGIHMAATLLITDAKISNRVQRKGSVELSCGYDCDLDETPGLTADGEAYDAVQRNIRGNHVAIVDQGRCGPSCATGNDGSTGSPKIVMLLASKDTQRALAAWCDAAGFDRSTTHGGNKINPADFDFHVTVIATANAVTVPTGEHTIPGIELAATGFGVLGTNGDIPVMNLDAGGVLGDMRKHYVSAYRAVPTFADFKPHVSLSYSWSGSPAIDGLRVPDGPLVFDRIVVDEFDAPKPKADAMPSLTDCPGNSRCQCQRTPSPDTKGQDAMTTKTVTVDGKQLEVTADVAAVIEGLQAKIADGSTSYGKLKDAAGQLAEIVEKHTKTKADEIAAKDAEIADLKAKVPTADQIAAIAADLANVIADAKSLAPDLDTKGKTADAIRTEAVRAVMGDKASTMDGKSADYIAATFDRLVESAKDGGNAPLTIKGVDRAADAYATYCKNLDSGWKE